RRRQEGRRREGGRRPDRQGTPPPGRVVHPLRRERGRADPPRQRAARHPHLRRGGPGAAGQALHEDHLTGSGGAVMAGPSMKIKKGDTVQVISGPDRGAKGKVIAAYPKEQRVLVEGVNRIKKHTRITTTSRGAQTGGIVTQEAPIHVRTVMVFDSENKPTRVGFRKDEDGRSVRIARRSGKDI